MRVSIFGTGYVGLVTGACLADVGHEVICVDIDEEKINTLNRGEIPIFEPGLESLVKENADMGTLSFTTDARQSIISAEVIFIAVGTPPGEDGSADLQHVLAVASSIGEHMDGYKMVCTKSTVPVGTCDKVEQTIAEALQARKSELEFDVVSNPEFLKEGAAINDFTKPDRIIVGTDSDRVKQRVTELYAPFNRNHDRILFLERRSAEMTKYAANAMLATKISFMNEMANIAEGLGADIEQVRIGIGADHRIGYDFIYPGCGYGGSCFPKDVKALLKSAQEINREPVLLKAVEAVNDKQKDTLFNKLSQHFNGDLKGRVIALWGLSFKPQTDDMREATSCRLMESLWAVGAKVQAFDPEAEQEARRLYGDNKNLTLAESKEAVLKGADALVICTEWRHFRTPRFDIIKQELKHLVIVDGRNMYDPQLIKDKGIIYYGVGRGESVRRP